ncbi:5-formyltetrahydrofolate cyclo-ligase [Thermosulfurimonas marina]|uniref:5-formyltetrahydrofolate cyclo-ligase n=1 Tax=Thermosulfurimonas marina TaxID=2047767 RepID=A0A6H1WTS4_9BACT|nr:5-formyltetrahydrofolate cyclo-ligase [Thermosulfurimonas marina]QJA06580.1 5-formyltetrahydrofolate cyclo-ligase [Thermosulfurimonas marina]
MSSIGEEKARLRAEMRARRAGLSPDLRRHLSRKITERLLELELFRQARVIFFFASFGDEVETWEALGRALLEGKVVALPRTHLRERTLSFHRLYTLGELVPGPFGILEPPAENPEIPPEAAQLVLVPGLAFDPQGRRLGYGGGFYDRLLSRTQGFRLALAFECQIVERVPTEAHDLRVEAILTEKGLRKTRPFFRKPIPQGGPGPFSLPEPPGRLRPPDDSWEGD